MTTQEVLQWVVDNRVILATAFLGVYEYIVREIPTVRSYSFLSFIAYLAGKVKEDKAVEPNTQYTITKAPIVNETAEPTVPPTAA